MELSYLPQVHDLNAFNRGVEFFKKPILAKLREVGGLRGPGVAISKKYELANMKIITRALFRAKCKSDLFVVR